MTSPDRLESNNHPSGQERNIEYQENKLKGYRPHTRDLITYVIGIDNYENWPKLRARTLWSARRERDKPLARSRNREKELTLINK
jgi:hypothetical protein